VGVDLSRPTVQERPNLRFFTHDLFGEPPEGIRALGPFHAVLSDLAPKTSGQGDADSARSLELAARALHWAGMLLLPGGAFLFKFFQGADSDLFLKERVGPLFPKVGLKRPKAVRKGSREIYALCQGFRGPPPKDGPGL
jgi:23S rRNA (uridine2552-2'-O)-methyltransferase